MENLPVPKYVRHILGQLEAQGFEAYAVGGCVRDMLLGKRPDDWDICTSAAPEQVCEVFSHTIPTGIAHGTVTVIQNGSHAEVTTFRLDGNYTDHRRPESVSFIADLSGDLQRRDFTINAMALDASGKLYDPCGGLYDLEKKLIRCVGQPEKRFSEDALRMLRALRFSATLGFSVDNSTLDAIYKCAPLCRSLAAERISAELQKVLLSPRPEYIELLVSAGLLSEYVNPPKAPPLSALNHLPKNAELRWTGLCALLKNSGSIDDCGAFLSALRLDGTTIRNAAAACALAESNTYFSPLDWKRLISQFGLPTAKCAAAAVFVLSDKNALPLLGKISRSGEPLTLRELALNGDDLKAAGFSGRQLGKALQLLLDHVLEFPADNTKAVLLKILNTHGDSF